MTAATGPLEPTLTRSVGAAIEVAAARLLAAGVERPRRDAELLMAAALDAGLGTVLAYPERVLADGEAARFDAYVDARAARMPLSRVLGTREFWSLPFRVTPAVLDPRPDSETLVETVLERLPDRSAPLRLLDLGTGSGCLLLALLHELPNARGVGLERDAEAAAVAADNAERLGLAERADIRQGDWDDGVRGPFDAIVCNPPYVPSAEIAGLTPEVARHDPPGALDGGPDGLDAYRALAPRIAGWLAPDGLAALEVGAGQAGAVVELLRGAGLRSPAPVCDLAGVPRCVLATPPAR